jgi:hypothetical protein
VCFLLPLALFDLRLLIIVYFLALQRKVWLTTTFFIWNVNAERKNALPIIGVDIIAMIVQSVALICVMTYIFG